jgi:hypothetical protein
VWRVDEGPSPAHWAQLRAVRPTAEDALATQEVLRDGDGTGILMGMDPQGDLHLLIPVNGGPPAPEPADLAGLRVRHRVTQAGEFLGLLAAAPHEKVFTPFCRDVIDAVHAQGREPWAAVAAAIRQWQSAFRPDRQAMSKAVQVGLAGELLILRRIFLHTLGPRAVFQWSGPDRERHDFIVGTVRLEVKATRGSRHEHEVSRLDQLWAPDGDRLFLASVQLEETQGGHLTVAGLIDEIIDGIRQDAAAVDDFLSKLYRLDWDDEMRRSGELMRFNLRDATLYEVDGEFPRLPIDFRPHPGVVAIRYTISLANLPPLDVGEVVALIEDAVHSGT